MDQSEEYWRKNGQSSGLQNSRVPLQPSGNYRDVDNQHTATHPHHTAEHGRKPTTSSALPTNSSTTGSFVQNIAHPYGPVCTGYECVDSTDENAGARECVGMYGNEHHQRPVMTNQTSFMFGSEVDIDHPFKLYLEDDITLWELLTVYDEGTSATHARLPSSQGIVSWDQQPALPTSSQRSRSREPYLNLPANRGRYRNKSSCQGTSTTQYQNTAASIGDEASYLHRSQLPTPSPSTDSHASLPLDSPAFPAARIDYTGMSQGLDYPGTAVQLAAVPFVNNPYPYPQSVAYGPSQAGPSTLSFPTLQQTSSSAQGVLSRKRGTETRDTASLPAPAAKKKGGNGKGPGRIPKAKNFKCTYAGCDSAYESKNKLVDHLRSHDPSKRLICPNEDCTKPGEGGLSTFLNMSGLIRHVYNPNCKCRLRAPGLPAERTKKNREAVNSILLKLSEERKRKLQLQVVGVAFELE